MQQLSPVGRSRGGGLDQVPLSGTTGLGASMVSGDRDKEDWRLMEVV